MKSAVIRGSIIIGILAALSTAPPVKAGEAKLPLQHGLYVPEGVECPKPGQGPVPSESYIYHGEGLSFPRGRCKITQVRHQGNIYYLTQRCVCKGEDIITFNMTLIIKSKTSFLIINDAEEQKRTKKKEILYRYCGNLNNR